MVGVPSKFFFPVCAHGAGRRLGRNQVKRENVGVDIGAEMEAAGIVLVCPPDSQMRSTRQAGRTRTSRTSCATRLALLTVASNAGRRIATAMETSDPTMTIAPA